MRTITPETSRKLAVATDRICDYVDNGMSPTDALTKVAIDNNMTEGQIDLVAHAYNAGSATATRREGDTFEEKTAAFHLADPVSVKDKLFPTTVKAASTVGVHPMYSRPVHVASTLKKVAADTQIPAKKYDFNADCICGCGGKGMCKKLAAEHEKIANTRLAREKLKGMDVLKHALSVFEVAAASSIGNLVDDVRFDRKDIDSKLAYYYKYASDNYGQIGEMIIDTVAARTLNTIEFPRYEEKRGHHVKQAAALGEGLHPKIDKAVDALRKWAAEEIAYPVRVVQLRYEIQQLTKEAKQPELGEIRLPGVSDEEIAYEPIQKMANIAGNAIGSMFGTAMGSSPAAAGGGGSDAERDMLLQLTDPTHEAKLKAIRAQRMLNDLARSDSIVSSYTPQEVAGAFNEISQTAPHILGNQALIRANMRRVLQGDLSPFEAKEILAANELIGRDRPMSALSGGYNG